MKKTLPIVQDEYVAMNDVDIKMHAGPFGLFNIDIYHLADSPERPFRPFFVQQRKLDDDAGDFQYIVGVVEAGLPGEKRHWNMRIADACWNPEHPDADLKKAMQFLMDLVNVKGE